MRRWLIALALALLLNPSLAPASETSVDFGLTVGSNPRSLCVYDLTHDCVPIGALDSVAHLFTVYGALGYTLTGTNMFFGPWSGVNFNSAGANQTTALGYGTAGAGRCQIDGWSNPCNGGAGMYGTENTFVGFDAGTQCTACNNNTILGDFAFPDDDVGSANIVIGGDAERNGRNYQTTIAIGNHAARNLVSHFSIAIGYEALANFNGSSDGAIVSNTSNLIGIGFGALNSVAFASAEYDIALGNGGVLADCVDCGDDVALGHGAAAAMTTGQGNVGVGDNTLQTATTGSSNTAIGNSAGHGVASGNYNIFLGAGSNPSTAVTGNNNFIVGNGADVDSAGYGYEVNINNGVYFYARPGAPTLSGAGSGATVDSHANAQSGTVALGSGTVTSVTISFAWGYQSWNHCRVTPQATVSGWNYQYTTAWIRVQGASLSGVTVDYDCNGV